MSTPKKREKKIQDAFKYDMSQFEGQTRLPKAKDRKSKESPIAWQKTVQVLSSQLEIAEPRLKSLMEWNIRKVDWESKDDMAQELATALLICKPKTPELAFAICRARVADWYRYNSRIRSHEVDSLNQTVTDQDGNEVQMVDLIAGEVEYEAKLEGKIMADTMFGMLDWRMKKIVAKRLLGIKLKSKEYAYAERFPNTARGRAIEVMSNLVELKRLQ